MTSRVVIVGSGSAGRRHAAELRRALPDSELVVVQRSDSEQPTAPLNQIGAVVTDDLAAVLRGGLQLGVVASPATYHEAHVGALLHSAVPTLVEKPVADTWVAARRLADLSTNTGTPLVVGYHLRVTDTVRALHQLLCDGIVGEVERFDLRVGQHLSGWRSAVPAPRSVSARVELGGGVLLELSHELDALLWLLGPAATVTATVAREGAPTDGAVDTVAELEVQLSSGAFGQVRLDMVSDPPLRRWELVGERGTLVADLLTGTIELESHGRIDEVHRSAGGERDRAEQAVIADLLVVASGRRTQLCTPEEAVDVLELVEAARRSAASSRLEVLGVGEVLGR